MFANKLYTIQHQLSSSLALQRAFQGWGLTYLSGSLASKPQGPSCP